MLPRWDRVSGALLGLLVGDALGVPYEFHPPAALPARSAIAMTPPVGFARSHRAIAPGTWSDDGAQALCLLASLVAREGFDAHDFARRLVAWYREGYLAVDGVVFDIGIQTERALHALIDGASPDSSGGRDERSNGNGSLMRVMPLALYHLPSASDAALVRDAHAQSTVTHGHLRSQACCALYTLWARGELRGDARAWDDAVASLRDIYRADYPEHLIELEANVRPDAPAAGNGTGYVVDCLHSARVACEAPTFEGAVKTAIALGNDTDTTACVAGGIAGARFGIRQIPTAWLDALRGRDLVEPLLEALRARCARLA